MQFSHCLQQLLWRIPANTIPIAHIAEVRLDAPPTLVGVGQAQVTGIAQHVKVTVQLLEWWSRQTLFSGLDISWY